MTLGKINFSKLHFFIQFLSGSNKGYIITSTLGDLIEEMNEYQLHYRILKPLVFTVCQLQCLPNGCEISVFWCSWYHIMHVSILWVSMRHTSFRFCLCQHKKNLEQNRFYFLMFVRISIFYCLFQKRSGWLFGRWELVGSNIVNGPFWNIPGGLVSSYRLQIHNTKMNFPTKEEL